MPRRKRETIVKKTYIRAPTGLAFPIARSLAIAHNQFVKPRYVRLRSGKTMTSDSKKAKAVHVPKKEPAAKDKSASGEVVSKTESGEAPASGEVVSKTENGEAAGAAPSNYSRGEGQKPVSAAYKENWNAIFAKKNAKRKR